MRSIALITFCMAAAVAASSQEPVSLDSCRRMALESNKQLMISRRAIEKAGYQKEEAFAAYLPAIDFAGGYSYNQKNISIFDSDQLLPTKSFDPATGKYEYNLVTNPATGKPLVVDGQPVPSTVALIPKDAMTFDVHNVFFGAITHLHGRKDRCDEPHHPRCRAARPQHA